MRKLLSTPLLPTKPVKTVLISGECKLVLNALNRNFGIDIIETVPNPDMETQISTHADCLFLQIDKKTVIVDKNNYNNIVNYFTSLTGEAKKIFKPDILIENVGSPYPYDVKLNVRVIGNKILCHTLNMSDYINEYAQKNNINLIHTNQGYSACSTILLNNNALITDDESNYVSLKRNGIDCILINKGSVKLNGYNYGFIGGSCGMIDKNLIAFTGSLDSHSDAKLIKEFLSKHNIRYTELTNGPLIDIGGIIPLAE